MTTLPARGAAAQPPAISGTKLAVAAKNIMGSVPTYIEFETGFTVLQFAVVGPLIALAYRS
jgi:hypothetical protein